MSLDVARYWIVLRMRFFQIIVGLWLVLASRGMAIDAVVVRPAHWSDAIQDWKSHRSGQGLSIVELDAELGQSEITSRIAELYSQHRTSLRFVLLAGDVDSGSGHSIPTFYRASSAMVQFGGDKFIATDNPYADVDGDEVPDVAVARIPADSQEQLQHVLERVIAYETNPDYSLWRRDMHVVAGVGGFGPVADSVIEMTTRRFLTDRIPGWSALSMTQASLGSHYCPDPWKFSETCLARMNEGGMLWIYIGHGHIKTLDYVQADQEYLPIMNDQHLGALQCKHPPIAVFLACYTGAFDASQDSLAEQLVLHPDGPIAAIAATRVSGPYGLSMLSDGLLDHFFQEKEPTLGEVVLAAKRRLLAEDPAATQPADPSDAHFGQIEMISAIASALSPENYDLRAERLEHVWQMHLLGDPMMKLHHPRTIELEAPDRAAPGEVISIRGENMEAGRLTIEFAFRRDQVRRELDQLAVNLGTQSGRDVYQQRYAEANNRVLARVVNQFEKGPFRQEILVPSTVANGRYGLRLYIESANGWQVGYREISVRQPRP